MEGSGRPWFEEAFGPLYPLIYVHRSDAAARREVEFFTTRVSLEDSATVLDLACGNGRHLRALRGSGLRAVGVDLSRPLLHEAKSSAPLVRADMRFLPFSDGSFDAVVSFFTSFGYFSEAEDDLRVLSEIRRALKPAGWFLMDFLRAESVRRGLVRRSEREVRDMKIVEERRIRAGRVLKNVRVTARDGSLLQTYEESVRLYERSDLEDMLTRSLLTAEAWFGDFDGSSPSSGPRLIVLARPSS